MDLARFSADSHDSQPAPERLIERLNTVRKRTLEICAPLEIEDFVVQPVAEVSPPKWHLAHTTWFFEKLVLEKYLPGYRLYNDQFGLLFNSYYKSAGRHWLQQERGALSRPTVADILVYRRRVEADLDALLRTIAIDDELGFLLDVGIHHEQQHQELLLMDIKYILGVNPSQPRYGAPELTGADRGESTWTRFGPGFHFIGAGGRAFSYDNERPRHKAWLNGFSLCSAPVSNAEFLEFIVDGAYSEPRLWLSKGWDWVNEYHIAAPLYWRQQVDGWQEFTLGGMHPLNGDAPVCHVSYFEADAYARWKGCRLPTEQEYEIFLNTQPGRQQVWAWTQSPYSPYPGFKPFDGLLGEYNGKFMCNQYVLRGGCFATPPDHYRHTYRNFFEPQQRWMFAGIRLASD